MFKVTREVLTSTSERKSGFDTADDEFETDDDRLRGRGSYGRKSTRSKDFRSTDEDADFDDWQDVDTFATSSRPYSGNTMTSMTGGGGGGGSRSKSTTLDEKSKCTCCPYGYHVDLDFLKHLNADEYENVRNDPKYLLKHHRRLHQMQQQQFQQRESTSAAAGVAGSASAARLSQQHQQSQSYQEQQQQSQHYQQQQSQQYQQQQSQHFQQPQSMRGSPYSPLTSARTASVFPQTASVFPKTPSVFPKTPAVFPQTPKEDPTYENALALYNRSSSRNAAASASTSRSTTGHYGTNGYYPVSNGYDPDGGTTRQETIVVGEDGSTTTKIIEEVHRTRTTIINFDDEDDEPGINEEERPQRQPNVSAPRQHSPEPTSPGYEKDVSFEGERLLPRQQHLIELQKKLQLIQPIDQQGPLRTYVNAASPRPVDENEEMNKKSKIAEPTFRPRPDDDDEDVPEKRFPVGKPFPDQTDEPVGKPFPDQTDEPEPLLPDPVWVQEKEDLIDRIRELEFEKMSRLMKNTKDTGVGDQSIDEEVYTMTKNVQVIGAVGQQPVRIHEKELNTEETTEIREKEVKTIFVGGIGDDKFSLATAHQPAVVVQQKETQSIGVGDGNVFEDSQSRFEVHEKELRTVYLGGPEQTKVATRNVGILCRAAMRDVGMVHSSDEQKPLVKNVAVGAGEIGVSESDGISFVGGGESSALVMNQGVVPTGEGAPGDESYFASSGFCHTSLTNIKGSGLAGLRGDQLTAYLNEMLKRTVHSVGTQCQFSTENKGTDAARVGYEIVSVGVSDDTVDVDVVPIRIMKSVAVDNRPSLSHRCIGTELIFKLDVGTNTRPQNLYSTAATNTEPRKAFPAATMTEPTRSQNAQTVTELPIFFALDQIKTVGVMTDDVDMYNKRVNTETSEETERRIGSTMTSSELSATHTTGTQEIRKGEEHATGYRRYVQETVTPGYLVSYTKTSRSKSRSDDSPTRTSTSRGGSRGGYTTTTVVQTTGDKSPRKVVTFEGGSSTEITNKLLGIDMVSETTRSTGADGRTQVVTESKGPGYTERVVKETYSSADGKTIGIPLVPGVAGFPEQFFTDGMNMQSSAKTSYVSSSQSGLPVVPERLSKSKMVTGSSSTSTTTETSFGSEGADGRTFEIQFTGDAGRDANKSVKGSYYTEKTVTTGGVNPQGAVIDLEFSAGGQGMQVREDGKQYITEVQCPGYKSARVFLDTETSVPFQIEQAHFSEGGSSQIVKSSTTTMEKAYSTTSSGEGSVVTVTGDAGQQILSLKDQQGSLGFGSSQVQVGVKTVIRESYGPNNVKTVTTEKVDMKTGKVISSTTSQSHYDSLPVLEGATSNAARTNFDFAKSGLTSERFKADEELTSALSTYALWLKDKSKVSQAQLDESRSVLQRRWFHIAGAKESNFQLVRVFLSHLNELSPELLKYVVNLTDENGNTALHFALSHGNIDIVEAFLNTGICNVDRANSVGNTPIMIAALTIEYSDRANEVLKKLFASGNVNAKASGSQQTALMLAICRERTEMVKLLLSTCCQCEVNIRDVDGFTALMYSAQKGQLEISKLLLATGKCDINIKNNDGKKAIDIAREVGHQFIVSLLDSHIKDLEKKK